MSSTKTLLDDSKTRCCAFCGKEVSLYCAYNVIYNNRFIGQHSKFYYPVIDILICCNLCTNLLEREHIYRFSFSNAYRLPELC